MILFLRKSVLLWAALLAAADAFPAGETIVVPIERIVASPRRYAGKRIAVEGISSGIVASDQDFSRIQLASLALPDSVLENIRIPKSLAIASFPFLHKGETVIVIGVVRETNGPISDFLAEDIRVRTTEYTCWEVLLKELASKGGRRRFYAVRALDRIGDPEHSYLAVDVLTDPKEETRMNAARILVRSGDSSALPALAIILEKGTSQGRIAAARILGELKVTDAQTPLRKASRNTDLRVALWAQWALTQLGDLAMTMELRRYAESSSLELQVNAMEALALMGSDSAVLGLGDLLKHRDKVVRREASDALRRIGAGEATTKLETVIEDPDPVLRSNAVRAVGKFGNPVFADTLLRALSDPDHSVRYWALRSLEMRNLEGLAEKIRPLTRESDPLIRGCAWGLLYRMEEPDAEEHLVSLLSDREPLTRLTAAESYLRAHLASAEPIDD